MSKVIPGVIVIRNLPRIKTGKNLPITGIHEAAMLIINQTIIRVTTTIIIPKGTITEVVIIPRETAEIITTAAVQGHQIRALITEAAIPAVIREAQITEATEADKREKFILYIKKFTV